LVNFLQHSKDILQATQHWLDAAVIGLNLCPYAKAVRLREQIRFVVSPAQGKDALLDDLRCELLLLAQSPASTHLESQSSFDALQTTSAQGQGAQAQPPIDTTLLIHPQALQDFAAYNRFLDLADALLTQLGLQGTIQIASFHPHYQFAGTRARDPENCSNRSPHPMLHLLREDSVARALGGAATTPHFKQENAKAIEARNVKLLRELGLAGYRRLLASTSAT
jgi:uncharacterized protein